MLPSLNPPPPTHTHTTTHTHTPTHPHTHTHTQLCYGAGGEVLVSGGYDAAVKVWDCRSRSIDPIQTMRAFRDSVTSVALTER